MHPSNRRWDVEPEQVLPTGAEMAQYQAALASRITALFLKGAAST